MGVGDFAPSLFFIMLFLKRRASMITLEEAKLYLRVDTDYDDKTIVSMIASAEALCADIARLSAEEWNALNQYTGGKRKVAFRSSSH